MKNLLIKWYIIGSIDRTLQSVHVLTVNILRIIMVHDPIKFN